MARIFVDSNYFVALFNPLDSQHEKALQAARLISKKEDQLVLSNLVFLEVVTVLAQRASRDIAVKLGERLLKDGQLEFIQIDLHLSGRSWEIFKEIKRKGVSFVDCSILAVMEYEAINTLLTFDQTDFRPLRKKYHFEIYQ